MMKKLILGNWKLNLHKDEAKNLVEDLLQGPAHPNVDVGVAPVVTLIESVKNWAKDAPLWVGAQNAYFEEEGAFTGECGPRFLAEAGASFCIVGHSERRSLFGETNEWVQKKTEAIIKASMMPVACIGETLEQRKDGSLLRVLREQLLAISSVLQTDIHAKQTVCIAYEPVWAIGTGVTPAPDDVKEAHTFIRAFLAEQLGESSARETRLLYGGSVTPENARVLLALPNVDGALVGRAALRASSFGAIIAAAQSAT
jgi:triosephosphate isomerase